MHHLVTTSLESTWYNKNKINSNILFLTSACKLYSRKHIWLSLKNLTLPYHWKEREKVRIDHIYLNDLYERVLVDLAIYMNESIKIKEDKEYWRIILGPWLILYISIIFDRWEQLRIAYRTFNQFSTSIISNIEEKIDVAKSYEEFTKLMQTDLWNHLIYSRIIKFNYSDSTFVTNQLIEIETPFGDCNKRKKKKKRIGFFNIIESIFNFFGSKNHIFIYDSYFSQISLIKLNLNLFQFPYSYREVFKLKQNFEKDIEARCMLKPNRFLSDFESFLYTYILRDIPKVYLEGGRSAQTYVKNINENPKVIVTANSHWSNDIFKWWMAEKKKTGTKIIISNHGGSIPPLFDIFNHDEDISDIYVSWFRPIHRKHVQLTPNKISRFGKFNPTGDFCSLIGYEDHRFACRAASGPIAEGTLDVFELSCEFLDNLDSKIRPLIRIRTRQSGWETRERYIEKYGNECISKNNGIYDFMENSKIIICTYPQTTFSEAMASGKPVVLIYNPYYNETVEEAKELIDKLLELKIIFHDPIKAAEHVTKIWDKPYDWWNSKLVKDGRDFFHKLALQIGDNQVKIWADFLKKV
jgi:putative transferase (TIGR04331 family)